jgi:uncharacterized protein (TIGR02145 family)
MTVNSNGCEASDSVTVTVAPPPVEPTISVPAICSGQNAVFTISGTVGDTVAYTGVSGSPMSPVTIGAGGTVNVTVSGVVSNQTLTITSVTSNSCTSNPSSLSATVTINPKPSISNFTKTICSGNTFTVAPVDVTDGTVPVGTTYSWAAPTGSGFTGGTTGTGAANISGTLTNTTSGSVTATYTVTPTSGSCPGNTFTVIVTVTAPLTGGTVANNQTICTGTQPSAFTNVTSPTGGAGYGLPNTQVIGTQTWSTENLAALTYNDGQPIGTDFTGTVGAYTWYNNDYATYNSYGALYNWQAVNSGKLCPLGWKVPNNTDWETLIQFAGDSAKKLKSCRTVTYGCPTNVHPRWDAHATQFGTDDYQFL